MVNSAYIPVSDFQLRLDKSQYSLMLNAYFDETGDATDRGIIHHSMVGMAGGVASLKQWHHFEKEWEEKILRKYGLKFFHMTDFDDYKKEYSEDKGWTKLKHRKCLNTALNIIAKRVDFCIGVIREIPASQSINKSNDPYFDCFNRCIMGTLAFAPLKGELLHLFVARKKNYKGKTEGIFNDILNENKKAANSIAALTIPTDIISRKIIPFQAADLIAFELRKEIERQRDRKECAMRYPLRRLIELMGSQRIQLGTRP